MQLLNSVVLATARWGTYVRDFRDPRLVREEGGYLSRTNIAPFSPVVADVCSQDMLGLRDTVSYSPYDVCSVLVLWKILAIDWEATFANVDVLPTGRYL